VDGNTYVDMTAGFGVAMAGHANARVAAAIASQAARLPHALGDVHPAEPKVALLERLAALAPGELSVSILGSAGAEAVEAALKTALLRTGRPGVIAFAGGYHGLTYGALAATSRTDFRSRFAAQLFDGVSFAPYPPAAPALDAARREDDAIARVQALIASSERSAYPVGAVLVEPIQGRGGIVVPTARFLVRLRELCDGERVLLVFDEIYTGFGRTGAWFACEHVGVQPDLLVVGKALTGGIPLSAVIGAPATMIAWPPSTGEAIHTSTFLGNPVACAAALAQLQEIEEEHLLDRARRLGEAIRARTDAWSRDVPGVADARGVGLLQGIELRDAAGEPDGRRALDVCARLLREGVLILAEGDHAEVIALTPPAAITSEQLAFALDALERVLRVTA
jgi:4-aminobutyrate aminotransferase / (S)-3-amino-2-methylpropionate transaminase / 5-aminovalerate transaminase